MEFCLDNIKCHSCANKDTYISVIDTETNFDNEVMSIGIVIADSKFKPIQSNYFIITPHCYLGAMFSSMLNLHNGIELNRIEAVENTINMLREYNVDSIFAYNCSFDRSHLPELSQYNWYDIMKFAAYKQYNYMIPKNADCHKSGRLKRGFSAEKMYQLLSGNNKYTETHNALQDALDELEIMRLLGHDLSVYKG